VAPGGRPAPTGHRTPCFGCHSSRQLGSANRYRWLAPPRCEDMPKTTLPPARAHGTTHGSRCEHMPKTTLPPARAHGTTHGSRCEHMPKTTLHPARAHGTTHGSRCEHMPKTTLHPARAHGTTHGSRCGKRLSPHLRIPVITRSFACDAGHALDPPCMQVLTTTPTRCWACPREVALGKHPEAAAASVELLPPPSEASHPRAVPCASLLLRALLTRGPRRSPRW
jgi:hypothetical protein